jgi:hypothetical protein
MRPATVFRKLTTSTPAVSSTDAAETSRSFPEWDEGAVGAVAQPAIRTAAIHAAGRCHFIAPLFVVPLTVRHGNGTGAVTELPPFAVLVTVTVAGRASTRQNSPS